MAITVEQVRQLAVLPAAPVLPDANVQMHVDAAELIVSEDLAGSGHSAERLELITLYLAAHFAVISEERGGLAAQTVGVSEERYQTTPDAKFGLSATRFGQQAIALDTSGSLSSLASKPLKAQFRVVGDGSSTIHEE